MSGSKLNSGSQWRRWEPHIHAPGTVLNDQYKGPTAWEDYLTALENATPRIEAVAVTDYYLPDTYLKVVEQKAKGRLSGVGLIFPNIELRLAVAAKTGFVNMHLLVSPEETDHVDQLLRVLGRLHFTAAGDTFNCTRADLIRLGRTTDKSLTSDDAALEYGATQFKVDFKQLQTTIADSDWAKRNLLFAVAGGVTDGTSGVRDAADKTIREEMEKFAHIIFASSPAQRDFWLGRKAMSVADVRSRYASLKPCLHGSDAHKTKDVGQPDSDRYSWVKGGLEFDTLRQACIDPAGRAWVGSEPPQSATPSQVISQVTIHDAPWAKTPVIALNPGLVAIIGARGSGKTALADMIAAGCDAIPAHAWDEDDDRNVSPSFLARARGVVGKAKVELGWGSGAKLTRFLDGSDANGADSYPRARYLSQQFVEDLCSSAGLSDGLLREIERVIFDAHPALERDGTLNFEELLEHRCSRYEAAREMEADAVTQMSETIATEFELERQVPTLESGVKKHTETIEGYKTDRSKLVSTGSEDRVARHTEVATAAEAVRANIRRFVGQRNTFVKMQDEVTNMRRNQAPEMLRQTRQRHMLSGMSEEQWNEFLLDFRGDVDGDLKSYIAWVDGEIVTLKGTSPAPVATGKSYITDGADLAKLPLATLEAETERLAKLVSTDTDTQRKYTSLTQKIAEATAALETAKTRLENAKGAKERRKQLQKDREAAYGRVFEAIVSQQDVLAALYAPLMKRLSASSGTLGKLSFHVTRVVDVEGWAKQAEDGVIDLRKSGPFRGAGTLAQKANEFLRPAWEKGTAADVSQAMTEFLVKFQDDLLGHAPYTQAEIADFRAWSKRFAQWLYSTDHVHIRYGIEYDGVDIRKLSPGTRGIVLLLLYLALDDADDRPLIIDQPEENLDPKSVFDELVGLFIAAKHKRQIIMVTHNANLVVNTDADQIIVAESGPHPHGALPPITYISGGLENDAVRKRVCAILEGGEPAFQERARRLRVRLER